MRTLPFFELHKAVYEIQKLKEKLMEVPYLRLGTSRHTWGEHFLPMEEKESSNFG